MNIPIVLFQLLNHRSDRPDDRPRQPRGAGGPRTSRGLREPPPAKTKKKTRTKIERKTRNYCFENKNCILMPLWYLRDALSINVQFPFRTSQVPFPVCVMIGLLESESFASFTKYRCVLYYQLCNPKDLMTRSAIFGLYKHINSIDFLIDKFTWNLRQVTSC